MKSILNHSYGELEREFIDIYDNIKSLDRAQIENAKTDFEIMIKAVLAFKAFGDSNVKRAVNVLIRSPIWGEAKELKQFIERHLPEVTRTYVKLHAPTLYLDSLNTFCDPEKKFLLGYLGVGIADVAGTQYYIVDTDVFNKRLEEIDEEKLYLFKANVCFYNEYVVKAKSSSEAMMKINQYFDSRTDKRVEVDRQIDPSIVLKSEATNGKIRYTCGSSKVPYKLIGLQ